MIARGIRATGARRTVSGMRPNTNHAKHNSTSMLTADWNKAAPVDTTGNISTGKTIFFT
jgi:hypothetical protein